MTTLPDLWRVRVFVEGVALVHFAREHDLTLCCLPLVAEDEIVDNDEEVTCPHCRDLRMAEQR